MLDCVKDYNLPVVLGGSGFSASPYEILEYLKADFGITGPGEVAFPVFLKLWESNRLDARIINGWDYGLDDNLEMLRAKEIEYNRYVENDGIVGFSTHVGCSNGCPYCIEAKKPVYYRGIPDVIKEIESLTNKGYHNFHLCDSEFNEDLEYSKKFCKTIIKKSFDFKWTLYMKPYPYDEELFELLSKSHAYLITLSVDSNKKIQAGNNYSYNDLEKIIKYCKKYDIEIAIDLLTGYPDEPLQSTQEVIEFFRKNRPKTVGINFYYRLFRNTELTVLIDRNPVMQKKLTRLYAKEESCVIPIFYSRYSKKDIEELICGDDLFAIPGITPGVNYQQ
ncbi:MAG: B12-binding domain-containing radical SAM protein [candidate division WOR-3 bacterium]